MKTKNWWQHGIAEHGVSEVLLDRAFRLASVEGFTYVVFLDPVVYNADPHGSLEKPAVATARVPKPAPWVPMALK